MKKGTVSIYFEQTTVDDIKALRKIAPAYRKRATSAIVRDAVKHYATHLARFASKTTKGE